LKKPKARGTKIIPGQGSIYDIINNPVKKEARDTVEAMLTYRPDRAHAWRGLIATPPGSFLESVVHAFAKYTDIPLEIPFFSALHYCAAELLHKNITAEAMGKTLSPDLWTVILAESGSGKTTAAQIIGNSCEVENLFPQGVASAAKFVEELSSHNRSLWVRDEFAQLLGAIKNQGYMEELKGILLDLYGNGTIERKTKREHYRIEDAALSILGLTVIGTFAKYMTIEEMVDGFAQRFSYVIADEDPLRPYNSVAWYDEGSIKAEISRSWTQRLNLHAIPDGTVYHVKEEGEEAFRTSFELCSKQHAALPPSFFRRILFRGMKYALLYHVLLGKTSTEIDAADIGWGARISTIHLQDMMTLSKEHLGFEEFEERVRKAEAWKTRMREQGKPVTARGLISAVRGIKSAYEANSILSLI